MKNVLSKVIIFAAGAAIGSLVAWKVTENKYEQILQDEIDSVKERYDKIYENRKQLDEIIEEKESESVDVPDEEDEESIEDRDDEESVDEENEEYHNLILANKYREIGRERYPDAVTRNEYYARKKENNKQEEDDEDMPVEPYIIEPDDFDAVDGYDVEFLTLYADGKLAYDFDNELVDDIDGMIGKDNLDHMGEFEEGLLHVRNEEMMTDFEITYDQNEYPYVG